MVGRGGRYPARNEQPSTRDLVAFFEDLCEDLGHVVDGIEHYLSGIQWLLTGKSEDDRITWAGVDFDDLVDELILHRNEAASKEGAF